jgi:hypothetical protein
LNAVWAIEDDDGSLAVCVAECSGEDGGGERKERDDHQQQGVQEQYDPVGCTDVVEHDVVVGPHLSDEQECDGVGEIGRLGFANSGCLAFVDESAKQVGACMYSALPRTVLPPDQ